MRTSSSGEGIPAVLLWIPSMWSPSGRRFLRLTTISDLVAEGWTLPMAKVPMRSATSRTIPASTTLPATAPTKGAPALHRRVPAITARPAQSTGASPIPTVWRSPSNPAARKPTATSHSTPIRPRRSMKKATRHHRVVPMWTGPRTKK